LERLYTCEEIAQRYSVKVPTVWRWIRNKQLPAINLNGSGYRVQESDLVTFEESKRVRKE
jgi:excisionase family DNA binding protein